MASTPLFASGQIQFGTQVSDMQLRSDKNPGRLGSCVISIHTGAILAEFKASPHKEPDYRKLEVVGDEALSHTRHLESREIVGCIEGYDKRHVPEIIWN
jgi:hypothetical protein